MYLDAVDLLNEYKKSDIDMKSYKILFCWWEQWRYRLKNSKNGNKINSINDKDICIGFLQEILGIINHILKIGLVEDFKISEFIKNEIKEVEQCIQNFVH